MVCAFSPLLRIFSTTFQCFLAAALLLMPVTLEAINCLPLATLAGARLDEQTVENFKEFLKAEATMGFEKKSPDSFQLITGLIPQVEMTSDFDTDLPPEWKEMFLHPNGLAIWPSHPSVGKKKGFHPFDLELNESGPTAFFTASRSLVLWNGSAESIPLSLKLESSQLEKGDLSQDILNARLISEHFSSIDKKLSHKTPLLKVLPEIMTVSDKRTGRGYLVRDLRPMLDGLRYLPGFGVRAYLTAGKFPGTQQENVKKIGRAIGAAKAELLIRYFLFQYHPHSQNILVGFSQDLSEPRSVIFRDISDMQFISTLADAVDGGEIYRRMKKDGFEMSNKFSLNNETKSAYFSLGESAGDFLSTFDEAQIQGFLAKTKDLLNIQIDLKPDVKKPGLWFDEQINNAILSPDFITAMKKFHQSDR